MYYIGIDIGGTNIKGGISDKNGRLLHITSQQTRTYRVQEKIVNDLVALCKQLVSPVGAEISEVEAVGMGIPGTIDPERGVIVYSNNIKFKDFDIVTPFKKFFNGRVCIGNDANVAALGEMRFGSGAGKRNIVFVTLGTGVGTGIIINGKLLTGRGGAGAEGGHISIGAGKRLCTCGRRGCFEAYASASALKRQTGAAISKNPHSMLAAMSAEGVSAKTAFDAMRKGDPVARGVVENYVGYLSDGLISLNNLFRPDCIIIGGGVSNEGDDFFGMVTDHVCAGSFGGKGSSATPVLRAALKNDAGILGAIGLVMD